MKEQETGLLNEIILAFGNGSEFGGRTEGLEDGKAVLLLSCYVDVSKEMSDL